MVGAGIAVMQRVALPDSYVPKGATVEITAKIAAGYHSQSFSPDKVSRGLRLCVLRLPHGCSLRLTCPLETACCTH